MNFQVCCPITITISPSDFPPPGICGFNLNDRIVGAGQSHILSYPW